ncbi:unnamed protein product [Pleuronectes platessa]|uniref:Uncharacterized protein n=1 Tax=Pleuronectes platessa TaxID=8262 RepID=A0A9N7UV91_PLEPL|nr:unnamed protein product [Pleuronectes platessa]
MATFATIGLTMEDVQVVMTEFPFAVVFAVEDGAAADPYWVTVWSCSAHWRHSCCSTKPPQPQLRLNSDSNPAWCCGSLSSFITVSRHRKQHKVLPSFSRPLVPEPSERGSISIVNVCCSLFTAPVLGGGAEKQTVKLLLSFASSPPSPTCLFSPLVFVSGLYLRPA